MSTTHRTMDLRLLLPSLFAAVLFACGTGAPGPDAIVPGVERTVKEVAITNGEPVTVADLSIEGMSCEMMCGGSIKKALAGLGVTGTEIRMSGNEGPDHAIVTYDGSKVTDAQMIETIQKLHDGQYKVLAITITKEVKGATTSDKGTVKAEGEGVSVYAPQQVVLPSILAILSRILRP